MFRKVLFTLATNLYKLRILIVRSIARENVMVNELSSDMDQSIINMS